LRASGDFVQAAASARRALAALQPQPGALPLPFSEAAAWEALGAAERAAGHRDEAREAYARALALRRAHDAEDSRWRADDERALASLQAGRGSRVAAR
jgi:tetratricopeptide (TPR) repeat protein